MSFEHFGVCVYVYDL